MQSLRVDPKGALSWRDAFLALALFAAIVRSLIPVGFMPTERDGQLTLVVCTMDGARTLSGETRSESGVDNVFAAAHAPCAFAALATLAPPPEAPILSLPMALERRLVRLDETTDAIVTPPYRPQAQRAPPSLQA